MGRVFAAARASPSGQRGERALAVMEQHLSGADRFVGQGCTIADIALYAYTHTAEEGGFDLAPYTAIERWLDRVRAKPGHIPQMRKEPGVPLTKWPG
ncbi:MAG TPA: glutathione binding-like protein [Stellaceae bacterium]|nr:glutathione binding-like protein [Stellaceae bacterium]